MTRPRIYGDESRARAAVARYIRSADDLIDQAEGVRKRLESDDKLVEFELFGGGWPDDVKRWEVSAWRGLRKYLQDQTEDVLPVLGSDPPDLPPDDASPAERLKSIDRRAAALLEIVVAWLHEARDELRDLQAKLGVRRNIGVSARTPARFDELPASGLVAEEVINDYERDMCAPHTSKQLAQAIGAAKEVTEATLRAALARLDEPWADGDDLPALMKKWRKAVAAKAPPDAEGKDVLDRAQAALANVVTFLAEWRNPYGRAWVKTCFRSRAGIRPTTSWLVVSGIGSLGGGRVLRDRCWYSTQSNALDRFRGLLPAQSMG